MSTPVEAALALAGRLGLEVRDPVVLNDSFSIQLHLRPYPVVARIAVLTPLVRDDIADALHDEVRLGAWLRDAGASVLGPTGAPDPGPHEQDGWWISLWSYAESTPDLPTPEEAGSALSDLHRDLAACPLPLRYLRAPLGDIPAFVARPELTRLDADVLRAIGRRFDRLVPLVTGYDAVASHGDAHPRNLLHTSEGWRWIDFEEACTAPVHWDLATMGRTRQLDGAAALRAYDFQPVPPQEELAPFMALRRLQAACWDVLHAQHFANDGFWKASIQAALADTAYLD